MNVVDHERLTRQFFRRVNSAALFRRFFGEFGVWETMGLSEHSTNDGIHAAWAELECPHRDEIEESLCRINDIGREKGRFTLLRRAEECGIEDARNLTIQKLAMTLFLNHRQVFDQAYQFFTLEKTDNLYALVGRQPVTCAPSDASVRGFEEELSRVLRKEAQGPRLRVEVESRHPEKWMAAIPHETYVKPDFEFDHNNEIVTRDRHPVYEMVLIYYPETGLLKLKVGRGRKKLERVAAAFASEILGQDTRFFAICEIVNFEPLSKPGFSFQAEPGDRFEWARPVMVRYNKHSNLGTVYEVRCEDLWYGSPGVLKVIEDDGVDLSEIEIHALGICFKFPRNNRDTRRVELARPNRVSLDETDRDRYLESVLMRWEFIDHAAKTRLRRAGVSGQTV